MKLLWNFEVEDWDYLFKVRCCVDDIHFIDGEFDPQIPLGSITSDRWAMGDWIREFFGSQYDKDGAFVWGSYAEGFTFATEELTACFLLKFALEQYKLTPELLKTRIG